MQDKQDIHNYEMRMRNIEKNLSEMLGKRTLIERRLIQT